ncbi:RND family efflux transporter MFP subunit [Algoriphagus boseongensis]|uniref:RND family efflux transporter MFP subunit n=1 Tax=Algoriphagus boseongensis TaxID=1442587 RepID=A0A4R6T8U9_9BACT|nr:efflux RND transporter periplasmic adaptor subunit [Algoriphagus boseongensis]TDQ19141.1 RND family efflux transporter MFP subunit [Algoriphagus boseongensis]
MKKHSYLLLAFVPVILFSCGKKETSEDTLVKGESIPVQILSIQPGSFSTEISASGTFSTKNETVLAFKVGGIISKMNVQEGDQVRKGQVLATLDRTEVEAGFNQAKLAFEKAHRDFTRVGNLYRDSVATLEQYQNSKTALDISGQQLKAAEFNLSYAEIRATQNGFVLRKFANPGQLVNSGAPVLQINGAGQGNWVLQVSVNDFNWSLISTGDSASIQLDNLGKEISGKVIRKSPASDPVTGAYWIEISPDNSSELNLASGMFAKAKIFPKNPQTGWNIPYEALLDAQGNEGYVFVTADGKTAKKVKIKLGKLSTQTVEVLEGLEGYSQLISSGSAYLSDGSTITIKN